MEIAFQVFRSQKLNGHSILAIGRVLQDLVLGEELRVNNSEGEVFKITKITAYSKSLEKINSGMTCSLELTGGTDDLGKYIDLIKLDR